MATQDHVGYSDDKGADQPSSPSLTDQEQVGVVPISEKKLLRKIDFRLLPAVGILYLLSFLDRSNGKSSSFTD